jgi:hypothetical protein
MTVDLYFELVKNVAKQLYHHTLPLFDMEYCDLEKSLF